MGKKKITNLRWKKVSVSGPVNKEGKALTCTCIEDIWKMADMSSCDNEVNLVEDDNNNYKIIDEISRDCKEYIVKEKTCNKNADGHLSSIGDYESNIGDINTEISSDDDGHRIKEKVKKTDCNISSTDTSNKERHLEDMNSFDGEISIENDGQGIIENVTETDDNNSSTDILYYNETYVEDLSSSDSEISSDDEGSIEDPNDGTLVDSDVSTSDESSGNDDSNKPTVAGGIETILAIESNKAGEIM